MKHFNTIILTKTHNQIYELPTAMNKAESFDHNTKYMKPCTVTYLEYRPEQEVLFHWQKSEIQHLISKLCIVLIIHNLNSKFWIVLDYFVS